MQHLANHKICMCGILLFAISFLPICIGARNGFLDGCSSQCTLNYDENLSCWNKTDFFFTKAIVSTMLRLVVTQVNILKVEKQRFKKLPTVDELVNETAARMIQHLNNNEIDNVADMLDEKTINEMVNALVVISLEAMKTGKHPVLLQCPMGCERSSKFWQWWSAGSIALSSVLIAVILFMTFDKDRKDREYAVAIMGETQIADKKSNRG